MTAPNAFIEPTYDDTMALLDEARNYVGFREPELREGLSDAVRLRASYETMRVTSRLTQVMAWLLTQKAVHAGEMTEAEAFSEAFAIWGGEA